MKRLLWLLLALLWVPLHAIDEAEEVKIRGGLPNFTAKLQAGKKIVIGYLGGSITYQPGYRIQTVAQLKKLYPTLDVTGINAGIGGTGSDLGVYRLERDVLAKKPDLLVVEYAVNDGGTAADEIGRSMEGIVRKAWKECPECDILFVYTVSETDLTVRNGKPGRLLEGKYPWSAVPMEKVADYYNIPSICFGLAVADLIKQDKMEVKGAMIGSPWGKTFSPDEPLPVNANGKIPFSGDGVHPWPNTGQVIYTQAFFRGLAAMANVAGSVKHELKAPMRPDNRQNVKIFAVDHPKIKIDGKTAEPKFDMTYETQYFIDRFDKIVKIEAGATVRLAFTGTEFGLYDMIGPDSGNLRITIDGKVYPVSRFTYANDYYRAFYVMTAKGLPAGLHQVKIEVLDEAIDKEKVLASGKRDADFKKNPGRYQGNNLYLGFVMVDGDLQDIAK